jgi:hypothetical protein
MYAALVAIHNILRWVVLVLGIIVTVRAFMGWFGKQEWTEGFRKLGVYFTMAIDTQLLLGLLLYIVFSEWGLKAIMDKGMSFVMSQSEYRYFAVEHIFTMLLGLVFVHLGSALPKKADESQTKFKRAAIWFGLGILLILAGIPWQRPLFPGM